MACAAITSFMSTISIALGNQSLNLTGDVKELMEVLHGKLDSLRTLVEEIDKIIRDREALKTLEAQTAKVSYCAEDMVESEMREQFTYSAEDIVELDLGELARLEIEESHRITNAAITSFLEEIEEESQPRIYVAISSFLEKVEESQRRTNAAITSYLAKIEESQPRSSIAITSFLAEIKESQRRTEFAISSYLDEVEASQQRTNAAIASFVAEFQESQQKSIASLVAEVEESQPRTVESFLAKVEESQPGTISSYMARVEESQRRTNAAKASFLAKIEVSQGGANAAITYFLATQSLSKEEQTTKVAYTAEKMESGLKELALPGIEASQGRNFCECLQQVIENLDSTAEEWMKMKNMYGNIKDLKTQSFDLADTSQHVYLESKNIMVGYDNELEMMQDQLVRGPRELKVISLVGMGGIGKTTFATRIFNEPLIISHFDVRAKITVSQEYHLRNIFLGLLHYTSSRSERFDGKNEGDLADLLQKSLKGRRYLVIVDDIWTTEAWDEIRMCFPFQNNGSRILLTTRNTEVADYASFDMPPYQMRLLSFDECWSLLYQKVFLNGCLTPELEKIGKEIARKCQGLPLATVVMAGVLLKIGNSLDEWTKVAEDVNLLMSTELNHYCSRVLALSYYHLPRHLKACLLYFVVFKKSSDIPVIKLVRLWAAEGFVKVKRDESFIMVADKCLKDLIDRSLVFVNTWSFYGKIKSCGIHDMIYGFCSQEAQSINFLNIIKENDVHHRGSQSTVLFSSDSRRISIQSSGMNYQSPFVDDTDTKLHSILCYGERFSTKELEFSCFKLLRVLDIISVTFSYTPNSIGGLFCLRYLAFTINEPSNTRVIANLKNLQSLIIQYIWPSVSLGGDPIYLPEEFWGMSQLRHLKSSHTIWADPPPEQQSLVLEHLHTISGLNPACCTPSVLEGISNVRRLQIYGIKKDYTVRRFDLDRFQYHDLSRLRQLESLSIVVEETKLAASSATLRLPRASSFPHNLKKLTFQATYLPWKEMRIVSKLPKLETLKLKRYACRGNKWETVEDGFPRLKFLQLDCTGLVLWKTCSDHFPCLERLFLTDCYSLVSIPEDFAYIMTLQLIELDMCKSSVVNSAKQIQQEVGDNVLHVRVKNTMDQVN